MSRIFSISYLGAANVAYQRVDWEAGRYSWPEDEPSLLEFADYLCQAKYTTLDMNRVPNFMQPLFEATPVMTKEAFDQWGPNQAWWPLYPWHSYIRK
jgi:hypothetical protein